MRDFQVPGRSPATGTHGMVATSHPLATLAGLDVLRDGGSAIDAAVAASAVLGVVEPQSTGIGGDCFVLYAPGGGDRVIAMNGSGRAPQAATAAWFAEQGIAEIDATSAHAVTVPGAIAAWDRLVTDHGRKPLGALLAPAIELADRGYPVMDRVAWDWRLDSERLSHDPTARRIFLPGGGPPAAGTLHRQPELAETLRTIASGGRDGFYTGPVAADMVDHLRARGGLHTLDDFATAAPEYVDPIRTNYRGIDIHECPPNGQGIVALIMLNVLAGFDLAGLDPTGPERMHLEIEAARLAYVDRDAFVADPAAAEVPVGHLLSAEHAEALRARIDPDRAIGDLPPPSEPAHRNTIYLCVVDSERNAVSFINSIFDSFGSGLVSPKTGVLFQNRGLSFRLDPTHPNCIAPGKRPFHTIIPGLATAAGRARMPFGVMGGHYQPYGHVHFLTNVIDYGLDVQAALDFPRVFHDGAAVVIERGIGEATAAGLSRRGHVVGPAPEPLGGGQAIEIVADQGLLIGGSDPRKDGCALGY